MYDNIEVHSFVYTFLCICLCKHTVLKPGIPSLFVRICMHVMHMRVCMYIHTDAGPVVQFAHIVTSIAAILPVLHDAPLKDATSTPSLK